MKTDDLIATLSAAAPVVGEGQTERRFLALLLAGCVLATLATIVFLGPRPDLAAATGLPMFWVKLAFPASLMVMAALMLWRLGHPGVRLRRTPIALAIPVAVMWILALHSLWVAPGGTRVALLLGSTWTECVVNVFLLSLPAGVLAFAAARGLAPTRLVLAGAMAGLFAGSAGALAYALHCPELEAPFLGVWYLLGMLVPAGLCSLLGRSLLRW
ncbi:NrsF family protein [Ramlibacter sp.]|uniref:NrsF family protein n=1 Tax=Ramlibacter sp. TaxID=1917967 RepID=UPI003D097F31